LDIRRLAKTPKKSYLKLIINKGMVEMNSRAKLTVVLKADETVVAEIEDANLWHRVLGIINRGKDDGESNSQLDTDLSASQNIAGDNQNSGDSVGKFAKRLGTSVEVIVGSLSPSKEPPYLELNSHNWEALKKNFPKRGPGAVSPIAFAGTALALWVKEAKLDVSVTQALAAAVLDSIGIKDPNPSRGIRNTKWLQARAGGVIIINPAEISRAQEVVSSYCLKKAQSNES
jgi:hypothetical protein